MFLAGTDTAGSAPAATILTTPGIRVAPGNLLVVGVVNQEGTVGLISSVKDTAGNNFSAIVASESSNGLTGPSSVLYFAPNCLGNSLDQVTVKLSSSFGGVYAIFVWNIAGAAASPLDTGFATQGANGSAGGACGPVTTKSPNEIILYLVSQANTGVTNFAPTGGFTLDSSGFGPSGSQFAGAQHSIVSSIQTNISPAMTGIPGTTTKWTASMATFIAASVYSVPDSRNFGQFPNTPVNVNGTQTYTGQTSSNKNIPPTDSRVSKPVACGTYPQNSRTPGTFGPGE